MRKSGLVLAGLGLAAAAVAGCGRMGDLERPAPMFGDRSQAPVAGEGRAPGQDPNASQDQPESQRPTTTQPRDPAQQNTPISQRPLEGTNDPVGPPPATTPGAQRPR